MGKIKWQKEGKARDMRDEKGSEIEMGKSDVRKGKI